MAATAILGLTQATKVGPAGVCGIPGLAIATGCQEAICDLRVGLMKGKRGSAPGAEEVANGLMGWRAAVQSNRGIQRSAPCLGRPPPRIGQLLIERHVFKALNGVPY